MVHLVHNLSEFTGRPGPFQPDATKFEGFNPPRTRAAERVRLMEELISQWDYSEEEARIQAHLDQADWQSVARYHVCIFSNFLTTPAQVPQMASELNQVFRALKPLGIVIVVGATGDPYPRVYEKIDAIARESHVQRATKVPTTIPCRYDDAEADEIKKLYRSVFQSLEQILPLDDELKNKIPRDVWDSDVPLRGPKEFAVRVYRAPNRPPGARFTKRNPLEDSGIGSSDATTEPGLAPKP